MGHLPFHRREAISWLRRLLQPFSKSAAAKSGYSQSVRYAVQAMPTIRFDPSTVSKSVKANLRRHIEELPEIGKDHIPEIYGAALRSILAGGDLHTLCVTLLRIEGVSKGRAAEISRLLNNKATAQINQERQASLGITHAIWMYANAPCMKNPRCPTAADVQKDSAHRAVNGKKYEIANGLFVDGKWTRPGFEEGCKCSSRAVLPYLKE